MGFHNNHQLFHRRVAALKQRRLSPDEEAAKLKELVARFSPTFNWTATLTDSIPLPTSPADAVPTTSASDNQDGNSGGDTSVTTSPTPTPTPTPAPAPATTPTSPATTSTTVANTNTAVAPNPPVQTTNPAPTTSTSTVVVVAPPATTAAPPAAVTTPGTTPSVATTPGTVPSVVQITSSRTISSAAASSTETQSSESGTNVGGIVGGLVGGLIGVAAVIFVIRFLLNRQRKRNDEISAAAFNPTDFRRSAILMDDPPTHDETVERGFNPRPPTMIERRLASPAPTFGTQYGAPAPVMGLPDYGYNQYQAYGPMQTMSPHSATVMLNNSPYPNVAYPNPAYTQSPFSPIATPTSASQFEESQQAAVLTRQSSNGSRGSSGHGPAGYPSEDPNYGGYTSPKQSEYVDLNRSSVTPFQAAQYTEISQKLGTEAPSGLDTPAVNEAIQNSKTNEAAPSLPAKDNRPSPSPFSDPTDPVTEHLPYPGEVSPRPSSDSVSRQIDDFPVPPSPVHSSLSRVDSIPPMLPEIPVGSRPSSYNLPASDRGTGIPNGAAKDYFKSPLGHSAAPSPLASGITVSPFPPAATSVADTAPPTPRQSKFDTSVKRPDTVYDDNDAYGGI
ncbi:hypothetical protein J132_09744 [Termitomyces sp. J132]|nr:hypothetical protein H2248_010991 [Termitomyces sp. 'cryptogamus']KNZ78817.1 hypothetical protein J132_09744 [Termitomyces sp. J132]